MSRHGRKPKKKLTKKQLQAITVLKRLKKPLRQTPPSEIFITMTGEELLIRGFIRIRNKNFIANRLYKVRQVDGILCDAVIIPRTVPPELKESSKLIKALIAQEKERIRQSYLTTRTGKSVQDA